MLYDVLKNQGAPDFLALDSESYLRGGLLGEGLVAYTERLRSAPNTPYPFQVIIASPELLKSAAGILGDVSILSQEKKNPADGEHYLLAKVVINSTTGAITSSTVEWVTTVPSDTATNYHRTIAQVTLFDGEVVGPPDTAQFTYGPISVVVGGGSSTVWAARLI